MTANPRKISDIELLGGHPAVDFVNTVHSRVAEQSEDYLHSYADLLEWSRRSGLVGANGARHLAGRPEPEQAAAFAAALNLRETIYGLLHAAATGKRVAGAELQALNQVMAETAAWRVLRPSADCCALGWDFDAAPAQALLGPIAWEAVSLLAGPEIKRIKECPPPEGCGWLFLDTSRNHSRTWCSMKTCGNAAKVKRFRARQR